MKKIKIDLEVLKIILSLFMFLSGLILRDNSILSNVFLFLGYLIMGYEVLLDALKNIFKGEIFDEKFLMTVASLGALAIGEVAEGVALMLFYQIGEYLQDKSLEKSKNLISSLASLKEENVRKIIDEKEVIDPIEDVKIGDVIYIYPGEKIPLDGDIKDGSASIDTHMVTGESLPRSVSIGSHILSGCVNLDGVLEVVVTNDVHTSMVTRMISLIEDADRVKTRQETFITKFAKVYTPIVVIFAFLITLVPLFTHDNFSMWLNRALIFLTVSCPCALVISIPLGFILGLGVLSKRGILLKGTNYFEALEKSNTVIFDKTGTLTEGVFEVQKIVSASGVREEDVLKYAYFVESKSKHPIAYAIKKQYGIEEKVEFEDYKEISGKGIIAFRNGEKIIVGNALLLNDFGIEVPNVDIFGTILHVALDSKYLGYIVVTDNIRESSASAIKKLSKVGISKKVILSGDNKENVSFVSKKIGVNDYYAELLPEDKVRIMKELKNANNGAIIYVGDGINDAPVLTYADLGVSFCKTGSDIAIDASNMLLLNENLENIAVAIKIAKKTKSVIMTNVIFSIFVKIAILILGALGYASMWFAIFADLGVTIITILYSFTLFFRNYEI